MTKKRQLPPHAEKPKISDHDTMIFEIFEVTACQKKFAFKLLSQIILNETDFSAM